MSASDPAHLQQLSSTYQNATQAAVAAAQAKAALELPKPTELFVSDVHGEHEEFSHILRSACGDIRRAIDNTFGDTLTPAEKAALATLVYYPEQAAPSAAAAAAAAAATPAATAAAAAATAAAATEVTPAAETEAAAYHAAVIPQLVQLFARYAGRYPVEQALAVLPEPFAAATQDLMAARLEGNGEAFRSRLINALANTGYAADLVKSLARGIQHLAVGRVHLVGDIYDRGPSPDTILDELMELPALDIQWGNHDVVWMGAARGQTGCIAHVVRNCARYANLDILTDAYGMDLQPLAQFALTAYADDPCAGYGLKGSYPELSEDELTLNVKIQKAMAIIQFKVEGQLIQQYPDFGLDDRRQLHQIDWERQTIAVDSIEYPLTDPVFPTVDPADPYRLTPEEDAVVRSLQNAFTGCEKLQRHMAFLLETGSLYTVTNNTLLFHACVPLNADGSFKEVELFGETYRGRALFDAVDRHVRAAFTAEDEASRKRGRDLLWWLWLAPGSPLFAKSKMATFEIYLVADKAARKEVKNPFYSLLGDASVLDAILTDFGVDPQAPGARIVCGHTPVKVKDGDDPVKCGGKAIIIDGGMSHAYQSSTGIAGFTLMTNAQGTFLATHQPLPPVAQVIAEHDDLNSTWRVIDQAPAPLTVADTDDGTRLAQKAADLDALAAAYAYGSLTASDAAAPSLAR